jgi:hypothetical protein
MHVRNIPEKGPDWLKQLNSWKKWQKYKSLINFNQPILKLESPIAVCPLVEII